jgi:hypothetical protein
LVCGALVTLVERVDGYLFVEPKFMQDGQVEIRSGDVIANLPYHPRCALWFDHHVTNAPMWPRHIGRENSASQNRDAANPRTDLPTVVRGKGGFRIAPSAARVVYEYYTEAGATDPGVRSAVEKLASDRWQFLLRETDKIDAGRLSEEEVLDPQGYILISMTIDGKRVEDEPYWLRLIELLRDAPLTSVLAEPEVKRRCDQILEEQERLKAILLDRVVIKKNVIFIDLRGIGEIPDGNRFLVYTLFPTGNISLKVAPDSQRPKTTAISVGYNIFNPTSKINVGKLLEGYGGGGHAVVGSCRVPDDQADRAVAEILAAIRED